MLSELEKAETPPGNPSTGNEEELSEMSMDILRWSMSMALRREDVGPKLKGRN